MTGAGGAAAGLDGFARAWAAAVVGTSYVSMSRAEVEARLRGFADRLAGALAAEPFTGTPGYRVGADLVTLGFAAPESLARTVTVVNARLLGDLAAEATAAPDRLRPGAAAAQIPAGKNGGKIPGSGAPGGRASSGKAEVLGAGQRLERLLQALVTGAARAMRDRTLTEQEAIRRAAFAARRDAERRLRESEARLRHAALHDRLTGLPNRAMFTHRLERAIAAARPGGRLGVCLIGLDGFTAVNDSLGYRVGDRLLLAVAHRLAAVAADAGHLFARLHGDEFAVLVQRTACTDDAVKVADAVLSALAAPVAVGDHRLPVAASIGVVERPTAGADATDTMRAADITLRWAKADGGGRWTLFDPERSARDVARYQLSAELPGALDRDEFVLDYQPLVDLGDGAPRGVEALARWRHPRLGTLSPASFIELAEDTGLIVPLGLRLLHRACRQAVRWHRAAARPPFVSVNLAVRQLRHPGLVADVAEVLDRTGLAPHRLQLELTESAVVGTADGAVATLHGLADLGVRLAIDDFGTGYANLAYLRHLPVHALKLDRAFTAGLGGGPAADPADETLLEILVKLGHALHLEVTAEGIETSAQASRIAALGCDLGQGWHFGRPTRPGTITRRLTA
ncbi:putative bifunctional diguanylate cyclase/phosphodiesterase [Rhizomonospora bruguierae]|uniref:putative bifunctional diguanylate cyclase/phosphodiesterase n=1 Tax=Rhizomonospora bruguierae TaxID=1581705 RepID=UPI0020BE2DD4|nr:bifunctional diguanylate cyclase/phosphodiesterase [Micromonospora sp. NBRC 107566]